MGSNTVGSMNVSCECCVLSGRGLYVGLIARPEGPNRVWCVWVWSWNPGLVRAVAPLERKDEIVWYLLILWNSAIFGGRLFGLLFEVSSTTLSSFTSQSRWWWWSSSLSSRGICNDPTFRAIASLRLWTVQWIMQDVEVSSDNSAFVRSIISWLKLKRERATLAYCRQTGLTNLCTVVLQPA